MTTTTLPDDKLDIGGVVREMIAIVRRNPAPVLITSAVLSGLPSGVLAGLGFGPAADPARFMSGGFGLAILVMLAIGALGNAVLYRLLLADLAGGKLSLGEAFQEGLRIFLPVLGVSILVALAAAVGMVLLIVPGLIIITAWCVSTVVVAAEGTGVIEAIKRSAFLTRGNRWRIFALFILWAVASWLIQLITAVLGPLGAFVSSTVLAAFGVAGLVVLYDRLRIIRDGAVA
ncbi:YciC family protein [Phenylobacterium deserti]|uniref:Glycerophosphoryl diester phosphodiesterase membrane domain-containing protein n=1 Tax=Phenylobacterium deserti TaxID=1914756 RepID=A0A328AR90_9CAUL|nr:YciC family protein [Phenylobacterium deserti]RAK57552.1 hypothetical protein DJ018_06365 [Phenylobacterium deserti]